jgi:hypothetical protein
MRTGRPPLELGNHGKISTRPVVSGHVIALVRMRLWDGDTIRLTATADTAADARALLKFRMAERLRLSELDAWRYLTPDDPFDELVYVWFNDLRWLSNVSNAVYELCRRIVRTQLAPAFSDLTIGEITAERIEHHLAVQRATSEESAAYSREAIELLLNFAVGEGVIISNPMGDVARGETPWRLGDLSAHRNLVRGRAALRREERLPGAGRMDD